MTGRTAVLLLLCFMAGCSSLPDAEFHPPSPSVSVVTYNVNWGGSNPHNVATYLLASNADVICLQETTPHWEAYLKRNLAGQYRYCSFHSAGGAGGIAIMSKTPLMNVRSVESEAGWFPALMADTDTDIGRVQILNVHLKPPLNDQGSATLSAYATTPSTHREELSQFLAHVDTTAALLIAGDFNENENREGIAALLDCGFTNALSLYDKRSKTWSWEVISGLTVSGRYDHILFSNHFRCTGAKVTKVNASDHHPVLAVFTSAPRDR